MPRRRSAKPPPAHARPALGWSLRVTAVCLLLWLGPVIALLLTRGGDDVFTMIAVFFSKMAVVTFGGAYAVLAYVAQQAVETYGWLEPGEMLDGLGLAETTPGPLIMVVQFVGFMGAYRDPGTLQPMIAGTLGGILTTWVTFVPCFLWIFLGAPFVEGLRGNRALGGALAAITAAVVGVILNLAIWFALHVLFAQVNEIRLPGHDAGRAGAGQPARRIAPPDAGRPARGVPLQGRHDPDAGRLCSARRRLPSARRLDLTQRNDRYPLPVQHRVTVSIRGSSCFRALSSLEIQLEAAEIVMRPGVPVLTSMMIGVSAGLIAAVTEAEELRSSCERPQVSAQESRGGAEQRFDLARPGADGLREKQFAAASSGADGLRQQFIQADEDGDGRITATNGCAGSVSPLPTRRRRQQNTPN